MDSKSSESKRFRERLKKIPHDVYLNKDDLVKEILLQVQDFKQAQGEERTASGRLGQSFRKQYGSSSGNTREQAIEALRSRANTDGLSPAAIKAINAEAETIIKLAARITAPATGITVKKIGGDGVNDLILRFTPKTVGKNNTYDAINKSIIVPSKARMTRLMATILNKPSADDLKDIGARFFNVGHVRSVSEVKAARNLELLNKGVDRIMAKGADPGKDAADIVRLQILSQFTSLGNPEVRKEFLTKVAIVKPESEAANQTDSAYEAALLYDLRRALTSTLASLPNDWAGQKSSDSVKDVVLKEILSTAKKRGAKVATSLQKDAGSSQASTSARFKKPQGPKPIQSRATLGKITLPNSKAPVVNLKALIPIINQRLPAIIRSHMGQQGRLVNRTGNFSEGAYVIDMSEGYGLTYSYQKYPYQTFESQGARDPRPLIEQSIREIAAQLVETRFNMRRV